MKSKINLGVVVALLLCLLGYMSIYTISEGQKGLLLRLGAITKDSSTGLPKVMLPGLHFRIPLITDVNLFDTRLQTLDIESSRIVTAEKKDVIVDYYAKWRIDDLALYFTRTSGNELRAETLLQQRLNDNLRAQFGKRNIREVVSGERTDIMNILKDQANISAKELGITVVDVRIKRIDLPPEVSAAVYERMRAERERIATEHRAEGKAAAEGLRAKADANVTVTVAKARSDAEKIRGAGDGAAAKIYADAYSQSPDFYDFYRSLSAYREAFDNKKDLLVLKPDTDFFKYFKHSSDKAVK